ADEPRLDGRGDPDEHREHDDDAGFPDPEHPLGEPARADPGRRPRRLVALGDGRAHDACASAWPVAAAMIFSSVAAPRTYSAVSRPSPFCSAAGSAEATIKSAMPSAASWPSSPCPSALVAMSMPRVGSSTISRDGCRPSHLASTTFCWLPPDSRDTGSVSLPYLS